MRINLESLKLLTEDLMENNILDTIEQVDILQGWIEKIEKAISENIQSSEDFRNNVECKEYLENMINELSFSKFEMPYE